MLTEVFALRANHQETVKGWIGRASELFDRLKRKTKVDLPQEARGWLLLNRCGLNDEQRAVVLARARGSLQREEIGKALRSCYPDMVLSMRKATNAAHLVEDDSHLPLAGSDSEVEFHDVEQFLAEHGHEISSSAAPGESFQEEDIAEVLAVSWKEKRAEISKLQRARKFQQSEGTQTAVSCRSGGSEEEVSMSQVSTSRTLGS